VNLGVLGDFRDVFSLHDEWSEVVAKRQMGMAPPYGQHPVRPQQRAWWSQPGLPWKRETSSGQRWHVTRRTFSFTCIITSMTVSGAGLTRVASCAAADVISELAEWMSGCMRGASDSKVNDEPAEGRTKELAVTTASICSIDDCMMLARAFNSSNASCDPLQKGTLSNTPNINRTCGTHLVIVAGFEDKGAGSEVE